VHPRYRLILAWVLLIGSLIGWPVSALTLAKDEPQFVLGLSWLAITLTALDVLETTTVRNKQEDSDEGSE
jgi:uncharacterized membrane protein YfcA